MALPSAPLDGLQLPLLSLWPSMRVSYDTSRIYCPQIMPSRYRPVHHERTTWSPHRWHVIIQSVFSGYVSRDYEFLVATILYLTVSNWNIRTCFYGYSVLIVYVRDMSVWWKMSVTLIFDLIRYISCTFDNPGHVLFPSNFQHYTWTIYFDYTSMILAYLTFPFPTWRGFLIRTYLPTFTFDTLAPGLLCSDFASKSLSSQSVHDHQQHSQWELCGVLF